MEIFTEYYTDVGNVREVNQDGLLIKEANTKIGKISLLCMCDGMGGLSEGEKASTYVLTVMSDWFDKQLPHLIEAPDLDTVLKEEWMTLLKDCNRRLSDYGTTNHIKLGTTCTTLLITQTMSYIIHIGDTRAYEINDAIRQLTTDQTILAREIALGRVAPQDAVGDARGSVLLQCIGASQQIEPDFITIPTKLNTIYLLCSDGFRNKVTDVELLDGFQPGRLSGEEEIKRQCKFFVELGKSRMERDNISVVAAKVV